MMRSRPGSFRSAINVSLENVLPSAAAFMFAVTLAIVCCMTPPVARAQDNEFIEPPGFIHPPGAMDALAQVGQPEWQFGFQLFHMLLEQKGLYTVSDFRDALEQHPGQTAVVLVGDLSRVSDIVRSGLRKFLELGGVVMIATDQTVFIPGLCMIEKGPVEAGTDATAYQGFRDCPLITRIRSGVPLMDHVSRIVANRCGFIAHTTSRPGPWNSLAQLPDDASTAQGRGSGKPLISEMKSRRDRRGRLLVIADHSIFINGMLWHGDNSRFAVNVADWLSEGGRKELLFLVDGEPVQPMFAMPSSLPDELPLLDDLPPPTLEDLARLPKETLLKFANRFVAGMEDADVMNELVANQPAAMPTPVYRQALYIAVGILAGVYILRTMGRSGQRPLSPPPRAVGRSPAGGRMAALSSTDLHRAGRELARNALRQLTGSAEPQDWTIPENEVEIDAHYFRRAAVRSDLKKLKRLAASTDRTHTSRRDLKQLARLIAGLLGLQKEGRLRHSSIVV